MPQPAASFVDPRAVRFGAALTGTLAVAATLAPRWWLAAPAAAILLAAAVLGPRANLWAIVYRISLRRWLAAPRYLEPAAPPRLANLLGGVVLAGAAVSDAAGLALVGAALAAIVAALAYANAFANWCLGCKLYGWLVRPRAPRPDPHLSGDS